MSDPSGRGPGRPRDPAADDAILRATLALLADDGYDGLSIDGIAARAGVGKATIYRRWSSKEEVVAAAASQMSDVVPTPNTGGLRSDLTAIVDGLTAVFSDPATARLVGALVARIPHDPALAAGLREGFLAARRQAARATLERAQERGELCADTDVEVAIDLLAAPFYYRMLVSGAPIDQGFAHQVLDAVLTWIAAASGGDRT